MWSSTGLLQGTPYGVLILAQPDGKRAEFPGCGLG